MAIEFTCTNILNYDSQNQRYVQCGAELSVANEEAGNRMQCSSCNQWVEIPIASTRKNSNTVESAEVVPVAQVVTGETDFQIDSALQLEHEFMESDGFTSAGSKNLQFDAFNLQTRCPKCSMLIGKNGACTKCDFGHQPMKVPENVPLKHMKVKSTGFSRWLERKLSGGSIKGLAGCIYALAAIVGLLAFLAGFGIGGPYAFLLLVVMVPFAVVLILVLSSWIRMATTSNNRLNFWQQFLWGFILERCRANRWSRKPEMIIEDVDSSTYDHAIAVLPRLGKIQVLDLAGTQLTDAGLLRLYEYGNIQCLVIENTKVTLEGVFRYQQQFPHVWVWYDSADKSDET